MNSFPKISIVTPNFNGGKYLEKCILSVINQNYPNLEYIIIDGGSTDNSIEIIKKYEKYLTYWVSEKDNGQSDAINKGIKKSTGVLFNWINSDDYYEPNTLNHISKIYDENHYLYCGYLNRINLNYKILGKNRTVFYESIEKSIGHLLYQQLSSFICLKAIEQIGLLNTNLHYAMDLEWWLKFLYYFGVDKIKLTAECLVNFRIHNNSKTGGSGSQLINERNNIIYAYCKMYLTGKETKLFIKLTKTKIIEYHLNLSKNKNYNHKDVLNWFYLHKAEINYGQSNFFNCIKYLKNIETTNTELNILKNKLLFRSLFLFPFVYLKQKLLLKNE